MLGLSLVFSLQKSEGNVVCVILCKGLGCTLIETDGLSLGWSIGKLIGIWQGFLVGIASGGKVVTPLDFWVGKLLGVPLGFNICYSMVIVLRIWDGFLLVFALGKKLENQEGWLDGDCVGFFVIFPCGIWLGAQIGVQIGVMLGTVFNKCDSSHVWLLFIDGLMSGFGKSVGNSVHNIWFTVNSNFILWINLIWSGNTFGVHRGYSFVYFGINNIGPFCLRYQEAMHWGKLNRSINKIDHCFI